MLNPRRILKKTSLQFNKKMVKRKLKNLSHQLRPQLFQTFHQSLLELLKKLLKLRKRLRLLSKNPVLSIASLILIRTPLIARATTSEQADKRVAWNLQN